jgi:hypothetical protein
MQTRVISRSNFLERRLVEFLTAVIIPDDCILFVRLFKGAQLPSRYSKAIQTLDAISGI